MNTQLRTSIPLFGTSKIARAVLTGFLAIGMSVVGLSSASATDVAAPVKTGIATNTGGTKIIVTYGEALAATTPLVGDYAVLVDSVANVATGIAISGSTVEITLTTAVTNGAVVTLAYTQSAGAEVQDAAGNLSVDFTAAAVTNNVPAPAPVASSSVMVSYGYSAAEAAAIRAANEAAAKAEAEKLAAAKAEADAKAAAEAAAKAAADKAAQEKAAAAQAAADKIAAEERAAVEAVVKAEEARVAAAEAKAAASDVKVTSSKSGTKLTLDLADKYFGKIVTVYVGTKKNGKVTYRALDYFAVDKEDGTASISTKVKLTKGQIIRVNVGKTVVKSLTLK
jgi:uncharacterized repeat protein (TIGR02059 family)